MLCIFPIVIKKQGSELILIKNDYNLEELVLKITTNYSTVHAIHHSIFRNFQHHNCYAMNETLIKL